MQRCREKATCEGYKVKPAVRRRHTLNPPQLKSSFKLANKHATRTAYTRMRDSKGPKPVHSLSEVVGEKSTFDFDLQEWDGR